MSSKNTDSDGQPGGQPLAPRLDLSRIRHELRTPINHILGYCEMLLEDDQIPANFAADLRRIHSGGHRLQMLIGEYFSDETFFQPRNLQRLYHELRTPVNQIIGYSELLQELAAEREMPAASADLQKIRDAAANWLGLMEAYLVEAGPVEPGASPDSSTPSSLALPAGLGIQVPEPRSAHGPFASHGALLVVDDDEANRDMLARRLRRHGYSVSVAGSGVQALRLVASQAFDLILLDMIMPGLDGFQVLARLKGETGRPDIPVIMLSALDEENGIARCIELGAEDYLSKPFNPVFLWARIGACLERKRLQDRERAAFEALRKSEQTLAANLAEAAGYVRSILPAPLTGPIEAESCFQPGAQLGGDAFGYHWLDDNHFVIYLLDVCGHGVGAALLSVSVLNTLRAQTLPGIDFRQPAAVLGGLNRAFPMEKQNQLYFTIWYGVYRPRERELDYSSAGHPPALLLNGDASGPGRVELRRPGPAIGCLDEAVYSQGVHPVPPGARLLLLSDGVFEIPRADGTTGNWSQFAASLDSPEVIRLRPQERLRHAMATCGPGGLEDDFSLVDLLFR